MTERDQSDLRRYATILHGMISDRSPLQTEQEEPGTIRVERGLIYPDALVEKWMTSDAFMAFLKGVELEQNKVVDQFGHRRPVYRGLFAYSLLQTYHVIDKHLSSADRAIWTFAMRTWCTQFAKRLDASVQSSSDATMPASTGDAVSDTVWMALTVQVAAKTFAKQSWVDLARSTFRNLAKHQSPDGPFLKASSSDNPETHWFHELVILHAAASYAIQSRDPVIEKAVAKNAEYHQNETQPDHATNQPWALFAFLWKPATRPLADQILHAACVQNSQSPAVISLMLLADALYCVNLLLEN